MKGPISVEAAASLIASHLPRFVAECIALADAQGRVLRQSVVADRDQPPFDRVMMDGIAIRYAEPLPSRFRLIGAQMAGTAALRLDDADTCLEAMTGAMLPIGTDTVIPVEALERDGQTMTLRDAAAVQRGQFVHSQGSDCRQGECLLEPGCVLRAPEIAVLATNGVAQVSVTRQPTIAIIATGDELVGIDQRPQAWQIRRSNDHAIAAALNDAQFHRVSLHHVSDDEARIASLLADQLASCDVLILSGGVSMGQRDYIPRALAALGVEEVFHRIAQRPGKPMWFGIAPGGKPVFALPGNPVSALVCTLRYVLPALRQASGAHAHAPRQRVSLATSLRTHASLTCFVPVALDHAADGRCLARPIPSATSGDFASLVRTDGVIELPPNAEAFEPGVIAPFYPWSA